MKIELNEITIKRLFDGFVDNAESGVVAGGRGGGVEKTRSFIHPSRESVPR